MKQAEREEDPTSDCCFDFREVFGFRQNAEMLGTQDALGSKLGGGKAGPRPAECGAPRVPWGALTPPGVQKHASEFTLFYPSWGTQQEK